MYVKVIHINAISFQVSRLAAKYNVKIERIKEGRYVVDGKINIFVRVCVVIQVDLRGTILSRATWLQHAYDTF